MKFKKFLISGAVERRTLLEELVVHGAHRSDILKLKDVDGKRIWTPARYRRDLEVIRKWWHDNEPDYNDRLHEERVKHGMALSRLKEKLEELIEPKLNEMDPDQILAYIQMQKDISQSIYETATEIGPSEVVNDIVDRLEKKHLAGGGTIKGLISDEQDDHQQEEKA